MDEISELNNNDLAFLYRNVHVIHKQRFFFKLILLLFSSVDIHYVRTYIL